MKVFLIPSSLSPGEINHIPKATVDAILSIDHYLVENEKTARRFISSLQTGRNIREELSFYTVDRKTDLDAVIELCNELQEKDVTSVGIISEAGCPGVADPGAVVVEWAHQMNWEVIPITGPSSILLALMASGFSGQQFSFHGYLPIDGKSRAKKIKDLDRESLTRSQTQIFMETPYRNEQLLKAIIQNANPKSRLCLAANITSKDQYIRTYSIEKWKKEHPKINKIPTIFLLSAVG